VNEKISYAIVSPNKKEAMIKHLKESKGKKIETFFDPGQALPMFSKQELILASEHASYLIVNQYEFEAYKKITGENIGDLLKKYEKIIVTL
jgi:adenosine kinase